jgi:hypothetical protein
MLKRHLPVGFIVPAQPVEREKPPAGPDWVHEIKHDGLQTQNQSIIQCLALGRSGR